MDEVMEQIDGHQLCDDQEENQIDDEIFEWEVVNEGITDEEITYEEVADEGRVEIQGTQKQMKKSEHHSIRVERKW